MRNSLLIVIILTFGCTVKESQEGETKPTHVVLTTNFGDITIALSNKTPLHRDNFISLTQEGAYDSLLFHRVIEGFVIQGGDPDSKYANPEDRLGRGGRDYKVPAEFDATLFHKRGAVGAARNGNPDRASSSMQFYIVQASTPVVDSVFTEAVGRINSMLKRHYHINAPENKQWYDSLNKVMEAENWDAYSKMKDTLRVLSEDFTSFEEYAIPEEHREVYQQLGGVPHLDQNYSIFGEVVAGMAVVDSIAAQATNDLDRPVTDIRILSARVID